MSQPTILLADNDLDFLGIAKEFLEGKGYKILTASDISKARHIIEGKNIALAILDYRLTDDTDERDKSGLKLAKETIRTSAIPKIILTQFPNYKYARDALQPRQGGYSAAIDFVVKQDGLEILSQSIQRVLIKAKIFLCYARPDEEHVRRMFNALSAAGFDPWMDQMCIIGGENWEIAIRKAIREVDFFVVCISKQSVNRRGFVQKEIQMALNIWDEKLDSDIYLIPVRLEDCNLTNERLCELQWINLFHKNGFHELLHAIRTGIQRYSNL